MDRGKSHEVSSHAGRQPLPKLEDLADALGAVEPEQQVRIGGAGSLPWGDVGCRM